MASLRYVILHHKLPASQGRGPHFDVMFETAVGLQTWAVETFPELDGPAVPALSLPIHRLAYLDYEGPVSNNRGTVQRVRSGVYDRLCDTSNQIEFHLQESSKSNVVSDQIFVFNRLAADHIDGCDLDWKLSIKTPPSRTPITSKAAN